MLTPQDRTSANVPRVLRELHVPIPEIIDMLVDAICVVDEEGRFVYVSAAFERIFGYTPREVVGRGMIDLVHPDDRARTLESARAVMAGKPNTHFENRYMRKDGTIVHIMWSARWSARDRLRIAVARDVTERKRAEARQASLYDIAQAAHSADSISELYRRIHEIIGRLLPAGNFYVALCDDERAAVYFPYHVDRHDKRPRPQSMDADLLTTRVIRTGKAVLATPGTRAATGHGCGHAALYWLGVPLETSDGVIGMLAVQSYDPDVRIGDADMEWLQFASGQVAAAIARKQMEEKLRHSALHDPLTGLPNRLLLQQHLQAAQGLSAPGSGSIALIYLDLDDFKHVNDTLGHATGDELLRCVAQRLVESVRSTDTVTRMGGDEFVILLTEMSTPACVAAVAAKVLAAISRPFRLAGREVCITASLGSIEDTSAELDLERMLTCADQAMYRAKGEGGNRACMASADTDARR